MTNAKDKISTILAEPDNTELLRNMQIPFITDEQDRFNVLSTYTTWDQTSKYVLQLKPQLVIINASIAPDLKSLLDLLSQMTSWKGIAIVTLMPAAERAKEVIQKITTCRGIFIQPISDWKNIADAGYNAVFSEQAKMAAQTPLQAAEGWRKDNAITGTQVVSFMSGAGGVGRSTIAENVAYRLSKTGIKTLLMSFDLPPAAMVHFGIKYTPNASEFFSRAGEGFERSIQKKDDLDIVLAPESSMDYARAMQQNKPETSIFALVQSTWMRNYAAIVLDLPAGETAWTLQPYYASNSVMLVTRPNWSDLIATKHLLNLMDRLKGEDNRVPKSSIRLVINQFREDCVLSPSEYLAELTKRCPNYKLQLASVIHYDSRITNCQDEMKIPVDNLTEFDNTIREIGDALFPGKVTMKEKPKFKLFGK